MTDHILSCTDEVTCKDPRAGVMILGDSNQMCDAPIPAYPLKQTVVEATRGCAVLIHQYC